MELYLNKTKIQNRIVRTQYMYFDRSTSSLSSIFIKFWWGGGGIKVAALEGLPCNLDGRQLFYYPGWKPFILTCYILINAPVFKGRNVLTVYVFWKRF